MRFRLDELPESARKRVLEAMGTSTYDGGKTAVSGRKKAVYVDSAKTCKLPLQVPGYPVGKQNKTERRFFDAHLRGGLGDGLTLVLAQQVRVPLPGGGTYIPDYVAIRDGIVSVYEVKGGYRGPGWEQGYERYKRAAAYLARYGVGCTLAEWNVKKREWNLTEWKDKKGE